MTHANKHIVRTATEALKHPSPKWDAAISTLYAPDAAIHVVHPFNTCTGPDDYITRVITPLRTAFDGLYRRDDILMSGTYDGADWVSTMGYYVGRFEAPFLGIPATDTLEYLRFGEFLRIKDGHVVEAYIFFDLPQLMIAAGTWPIESSPGIARGYTGFLPGPATNDGIMLGDADPAHSQSSYQMVTDMLAGLATEDEAWRPYWHPNMVWYGPAAFGSFLGLEAFAGFQVPFENAFHSWSGGSSGNGVTAHFTRFGDGDYVCSGGWPSLMAVRKDPFLDQPSNGETLLMRVCDWWRREYDLLVENWVFVDIPHTLLQMGLDLFPGLHDLKPGLLPLTQD